MAIRQSPKGGIGPFKPPKVKPPKPVLAAPRLKPIQSRDYGKQGTPLSSAPDTTNYGLGIGMGFNKSGGI